MIKVPGTLFFLGAVISFSKTPHLTATQTSVLSGILFDGHFIPQNWSILEFQQSKLAASIAFCCRHFLLNPSEITHTPLWTYVAFFCLDKPEKRRFLCWLCTDWKCSPMCAHNLSTSDVQGKNWFQKRPGHQWVKIEEEGRRTWGERLYSPESLSKLQVSWLAWTYSKPVNQVRIYSYFLLLKKSFLNSQSGVKISPKMELILLLTWVVFTLFGVTLTLKLEWKF